ncbi:MAG TPA: hypothetical protein VH436_20775, partial [Vicinamibacterales bacterium]
MDSVLLEAAVRALLMALATGALVWVMRVKTAAGQHAAWTVVLLGMLMLPLWMLWGPKASLPVTSSRPLTVWAITAPAAPALVSRFETAPDNASPSTNIVTKRTESPIRRVSWRTTALLVYGIGVLVLLVRLMAGTVHAQRLIRRAARDRGHWTSDVCAAPVTVGRFRPIVILPQHWATWPEGQLAAVMVHEQ